MTAIRLAAAATSTYAAFFVFLQGAFALLRPSVGGRAAEALQALAGLLP